MNFNIYIDKQTGERLDRLARKRRTSRNALIREALTDLVGRRHASGWPAEVLEFEGLPEARRFEFARGKLKLPRKDPLA